MRTPSASPHSRDHSQHDTSATASMKSAQRARGARNTIATTTTRATTAVITRVASIGKASAGLADRFALRELLAGAPEAALPAAVGGDGFVERLGAEVGPQRVGEVELGVGELPEEEVGDALLAAGADEEVGLRRVAHGEEAPEALLGDRRDRVLDAAALGRLQDVPAPAIVRGDGEGEPGVLPGELLAAADVLADAGVESREVAHDAKPDAVGVELLHFLLEGAQEELHEERDLLGRTAPVLAREREQREVLDAALDARLHGLAHRLHAALVPGDARQEAALRPAPVAVHDDRHVPRHVRDLGDFLRGAGELGHGFRTAFRGPGFAPPPHTDITSFSFSATSLSMSAMDLSVSFWTSSCERFSWSSLVSPFLRRSFRWVIASRRMLRTATFAFSPSCFTILVSSRRRSSVSGGIGMRTTSPEVAGFTPRSESRIAFSTTCTIFFSNGWIAMVRASARVTFATWFNGTSDP